MRVHRNILPRCWVIQAEQEKGGKDMTLPEQERERFCQVLHHSRTSLYRLAFSITRNSSDAQEAVAGGSLPGPMSGILSCGKRRSCPGGC